MRLSSLVVLSWFMAMAACGAGEPAASPDAAGVDAVGEATSDVRDTSGVPDLWEDPPCHYDCLGYRAGCVDGVVRVWHPAAVPCAYWHGECPSTTVPCPDGEVCGVTSSSEWMADPTVMCTPAVALGGACTMDEECLEPPSVRTAEGAVVVAYYGCSEAGICEEEPPPAPADYMAPCEAPFELPASWQGVTIPSDACSGGLCLVAWRTGEACLGRGCTMHCIRDQDCPQGSLCVAAADLALAQGSGGPDQHLCVPGGELSGAGGAPCAAAEPDGD